MMLVSFLALILIGCGESGSPGGSSGPGVTASIALSAGAASLPADGKSSTPITAVLTDSVGASVYQQTSVVFSTNLGTFRNGAKEYRTTTADDSGTVVVQLTAEELTGNAEVWVESNKVKQKVEVNFFDPHKVGTISLRTGSASIKADGVSQVAITATVTDAQGNPEAGAEVKLNTTLGQFYEENPIDPSILNQNTTAVTDVDGEAVVMLISGKTIGTATILASLNGLNTTANVVFTAGEPETISLRAAPSTIRPKGTTQLFAKLQDINGNPVEGSTIVFSQMINASEGALNSLTAATNVNGEAQVTYTAGKDPGSDIIQAALSSDLNMKATTTIVVDPGATVIGGITVTAGSSSIVADGLGKVKIRATVTDVDGNPASAKTVTFRTTAGTLSSVTATTSDIGLAEITLQASTIAGPATVIAECDGFIGEAIVEFVPGPAHHLIMYAIPNIVPPNGAFSTATIIQDQYDNRIDDQRLMLQVRRAGYSEIVDSAELTPDQAEDGVFRFDWTAATAYGPGNLEITAKVNNGVSKTVTVVVDEAAIIVGSITVTAGAAAIKANGLDSTTIRAIVLDYNGNPAQGIKVNFTTTLGTLSVSQRVTDQNGIAEIRLTSGTTWGTATVTADANGFKGQTAVRFTSGQAGGVSLTALPLTVLPGGQSTIIAEINNGSGAPVAGETLYFNIYDNNTNASLSSVQGVSDVNGRATVIYTGGIIEDVDSIRVTAASDSRITDTVSVRVAIPSGTVGSITLTSEKPSLPADGKSSTAVTATVLDTAGNPMPIGTEVIFETNLGTFAGGGKTTTIAITGTNGTVMTSLISGVDKGVATVSATAGAVKQSIQVIFEESGTVTVAEMLIDVSKRVIDATGSSSSDIKVLLRDENHNPIQGATINFSTNLGTVTGSAITGTDGYAYINGTAGNYPVLTSARQNGVATVKAWYGPKDAPYAKAETTVTFTGVTINVTADPDSLSTRESSTIKATLKGPSGDALVDQEIILETSLGKFTKIDSGTVTGNTQFVARTDSSGTVSVKLSSTTGGSALVTGWHAPTKGRPGETSDSQTVMFTGKILTMTPVKTTIAADGADSTRVILKLINESGSPISGQTISLATTLGSIDKSVITDAVGEAEATLRAGTVIGLAKLTAIAVLQDGTKITVTAEVTFVSDSLNRLELVAEPSTIKINTGTSNIRAMVRDAQGNPVYGATVAFTLIKGPGGGESITPATAQTGGAGSSVPGQATAVFKAGSLSSELANDVIIEASVGDLVASTSLTITSDVRNISLGACTDVSACLTDNGDGSYSIPVSAILSDINGIAVPAGVLVSFAVGNAELGTIISPVATDASGRANTTLTYPATKAGNDINIIATTGGLSESVLIKLPTLGDDAITEILLDGPASVLGDAMSSIRMAARAIDASGEEGFVLVEFASNKKEDFTGDPAGFFTSESFNSKDFTAFTNADTDPSGAFVSQDYNAYIRANLGNMVTSNIKNILVKGVTLTVQSAKTILLADGVSTTTLTAVLKETSTGMPIVSTATDPKLLSFGVTNGLISGSGFTDATGTVQVVYTSVESAEPTTAAIRCYYGADIVASTEIKLIVSADVASIHASVDKQILENDPAETATITAQVLDATGNPVIDGQPVTFTIISGPGQVQATATTSGGIATAQFTATPVTGVSNIKIASGDKETTIQITIAQGGGGGGGDEIAAIALVAARDSILPGDIIAVTAMVYDASGHGMAGQSVVFAVDDPTLGSITTGGTTGTDGTFVATFEARTNTGTVNITATSGTVSSAPKAITIMSQLVGNITLTANPTEITVTKTATITAFVTDSTAAPVDNGTTVYFTLDNPMYGTITATATTNAGFAVATFTAANVAGTVTIIANSGAISRSIPLTINPAEAASIEFDSVSKNPVAVKGTGGQEFSIITFNVMDVNGNPANDIDVLFTMTSAMNGGEYLEVNDSTPYSQVVGTTNGVAKITLHSGYKAGTISITASITTASLTTISATTPVISIGGGVPTDEWLTVSVAEPGWNMGGLACVGVETEITAWLSDRFGNFNVLDGYTVSFQSEVGLSANPIGVTDGATGTATSVVRTQGGSPKDVLPETWEENLKAELANANPLIGYTGPTSVGDPLPSGHPRDGVCNVLVFVMGEESFADGSNGFPVNGVYDIGETFTDTIDDPWRDYDDDGLWDNGLSTTPWTTALFDPVSAITANPMEDAFQDRNGNNIWDGKNLVWDGNKNIYRQVNFLITGTPLIRFNEGSFTVPNGGTDTVRVIVLDQNYNPLSAGSTYTVSVDQGKIVGGVTSYEYPSSSFYGRQTTTDWDGGGITDSDWTLAQRSLLENEITIADADGSKIEQKGAALTVTVTWKSNGGCGDVVKSLTIPGVVDVTPSITLTVNPASIPTGNTSIITAEVDDTAGNDWPAGTTVTFTVSGTGTGTGTFSQSTALTNAAGEATTAFTGTGAGDATIKAEVKLGWYTESETATITINP